MNVFQSSPTNQESSALFESFSHTTFGHQFSQKLVLGRYEELEQIGSGSYGSVYKARDVGTGELVAIKKFFSDFESLTEVEELKELQVLQRFKHPNIIETKMVDIEKNKLMIVFEHLDLNLTEFIRERAQVNQNPFAKAQKKSPDSRKKESLDCISEEEIIIIIKQILMGLDYIHEKGYIHRDLKPENFMINPQSLELKIIDFGTVKDIANSNPPFTTYICTRWYRAPECVLRAENYGTASDIFAVGCIMAELFNLRPLFPGSSELDQVDQILKVVGTEKFSRWKDGVRLARKLGYNLEVHQWAKQPISKLIPHASPEAQHVLKEMIKLNPAKRPSAKQLLTYPIFKNAPSLKKGGSPSSLNAHSPAMAVNQQEIDEVFQATFSADTNKYHNPKSADAGDFARGDSFGLQSHLNNLKDYAKKITQQLSFGDDELQQTPSLYPQHQKTMQGRKLELNDNEYDLALMYQRGAMEKGLSPKEGFSFASRVQEERRKSNIFQGTQSQKSNERKDEEHPFKKSSSSFENLKSSTQNYSSSFNTKSFGPKNQKSYDNIFKSSSSSKPLSLTQNNSPQLLSANIRKSSYNQSPMEHMLDRDHILDNEMQAQSNSKTQDNQESKPEKGFLLRNDSFGSL